MGINQAMGAFGRCVGPLMAGVLFEMTSVGPWIAGFALAMLGLLIAAFLPATVAEPAPNPMSGGREVPLAENSFCSVTKMTGVSYLEMSVCSDMSLHLAKSKAPNSEAV
eukprot:TRINITY_DN17838_c0_g1_i2.p1 TRINITY_DN17838_c0_g1~~TRINITY_DN17838_c0_g1_i2.p1  ORF type:complete len:109 (+),score=13.12 TRINITY_DN17838_c0_g1_i2:201-527(+)